MQDPFFALLNLLNLCQSKWQVVICMEARDSKFTGNLWMTLLYLTSKFGEDWIYGVWVIPTPKKVLSGEMTTYHFLRALSDAEGVFRPSTPVLTILEGQVEESQPEIPCVSLPCQCMCMCSSEPWPSQTWLVHLVPKCSWWFMVYELGMLPIKPHFPSSCLSLIRAFKPKNPVYFCCKAVELLLCKAPYSAK